VVVNGVQRLRVNRATSGANARIPMSVPAFVSGLAPRLPMRREPVSRDPESNRRATAHAADGRRLRAIGLGAPALGGAREATPSPAKDLGDSDLTNKVRTELFRGLRGVDKGQVDVNVVDGAVYLRGIAKTPQQVNEREERARAIPEVREVHNLLHLPDTPAPTRTDTPAAQRKTRRKPAAPRRPRTEPRRLNADKTAASGEATPDDLAKQRAGRRAAPLGAQGGTDESAAPTPAEQERSRRFESSGPEKGTETGVGTESRPEGGGGEIVH
jgi:hypothetical protein